MSEHHAASTAPTWKPRRLKVPRADRSLLVDPSLEDAAAVADENGRLLTTDRVMLSGRSLKQMRRWAREECFSAAREYTESLLGDSVDQPDASAPLVFVAGHQPSLYHPGVWVKNFAIDRLAKQTGGVSLNLIVDNDTLGSTSLRVPTGTRETPSIARVPFDASRSVQPWEDASIVDAEMFESFAGRVSATLEPWGIDPMLSDIWPDAIAHRKRSSRLCDCLSAARHRQERRWGLSNYELPISRLCETDSFLWFASHILAQLPTFQACHNGVLEAYRRLNRVRSRNHPVPRLAEIDDWLEAPFWVWHEGESQRHGVFAKQIGREVHLSNGDETFATLPLSPEMDACCAVEALRELPSQGLRFRTRALTTTLFARLCLGDLFVHGIGGAKYDEMTDQIISGFYGLKPPGFATLSATLHLPIAESFAVSIADERRLQRALRDLDFNADRHGLGFEAAALIGEKQSLIAEQQSIDTDGLSRRERDTQRPANRERHHRLKRVNEQLSVLAAPQRASLERQLAETEQQLAANAVLQDREFSFSLYPPEMLRDFLCGESSSLG